MDEELPVIMGLCLVDFHHTRGPEVEYWCGIPEGTEEGNLFPNLPFQALPDGSHSFKETFTYFTLLYNEKKKCSPPNGATGIPDEELKDYRTLFAISCSRQIRSDDLTFKEKDITRSTVQKAIVVISRKPIFGQIKDKVSLVTNAFFLQLDFSDKTIITSLYESLMGLFKTWDLQDGHFYLGLSLRRIIYDFRKDTLVLLKALLLERRIIFYGNNVEALCNLQFGLISMIPNLLSHLKKSGSPLLYEDLKNRRIADSFRSSDRKSVLRFLGFPLLIFEKGGLFSPYTPLQQMQDISSEFTKFFVIGTSNSLLAERKSELCDIFVNVDESSIEIINKSLNAALAPSNHDKKWIDSIANTVISTWNENDLETPKNSQFEGSEDFIRWQFEDYLTGLISSIKLSDYLESPKVNDVSLQSIPEEIQNSHPIQLFNMNWVQKWQETQNFNIFNKFTDDRIFDLFTPKHAYIATDPFTAFQQKLAVTFQSLKKNNGNNDGLKSKENWPIPGRQKDRDSSLTKTASIGTSVVSSIPDTDSNNNNIITGINGNNNNNDSNDNSNHDRNDDSDNNDTNKETSMWSSWKDYFRDKRKHKRKESAASTIKSTQHLEFSCDTSDAIDSALLGLGLHRSVEGPIDTGDNYEGNLKKKKESEEGNKEEGDKSYKVAGPDVTLEEAAR